MQTLIQEVLAAWREAERSAAAFREGSPEQQLAQEVASKLRELHGLLTNFRVSQVDVPAYRALLTEIQGRLPPPPRPQAEPTAG
jgi:hypothetical protein